MSARGCSYETLHHLQQTNHHRTHRINPATFAALPDLRSADRDANVVLCVEEEANVNHTRTFNRPNDRDLLLSVIRHLSLMLAQERARNAALRRMLSKDEATR